MIREIAQAGAEQAKLNTGCSDRTLDSNAMQGPLVYWELSGSVPQVAAKLDIRWCFLAPICSPAALGGSIALPISWKLQVH